VASRTSDGVEIKPGLRVWTNGLKRGVVSDYPPRMMPDEWYLILLCDGGTEIMNGVRIITVHPFTGEAA
jgi:hypothetical protein